MHERWPHVLLAALLLGHLFLLSTHKRFQNSPLEGLLLGALGPVGHAMVATADGARDLARDLRLASSLRRENRELREELLALRQEVVRLQGVEERLERLSRDTNYTRPSAGETILADVVYVDETSWLRTLVLYTGTETTRRNQPVATADGLVGRIVVPAGRYAKVLLLSDPALQASAMISRTRQRGVVRGGEVLHLEHVPLNADVRLGDEVVTAGIDGVFPRGIRVGRVSAVSPGEGLFQRVTVTPAVDFASLDQVWILTYEAVPARLRNSLREDGP